jgi:phosphatidylserine decarboxylase
MHLEQIEKVLLVPIHRDGWPFIGGAAIATVVLFLLAQPLGWLGLLVTVWCARFFRDPPRVVPQRDGLVVSPADGVVQMIAPAVPPAELELGAEPLTRISVFMNVFDVHVNRAPIGGTVDVVAYKPGRFLNAELDKASEDNERMAIKLTAADGRAFGVVQIAGLVARRIRCDLEAGQTVQTGERFGMIRFGSRVDVYLPDGVAALVCQGQRALAGETVLADLSAGEANRTGSEI